MRPTRARSPASASARWALGAPEPQPLTGEGENLELVANLPIDPGTQGIAASDLELHGNHAFVGSYGEGVVIVDISDPRNPKRAGKFNCPGGQNDIQLSPDGALPGAGGRDDGQQVPPGRRGHLDHRRLRPAPTRVEVAWIGQDKLVDGSHNNTLDWPYLYVDQYTNTYSKLEIFDLSTPSAPKKIGGIDYGGQDSHHDLIVDHRPDGKSFAYAASINFSDVIDVTDPTQARAARADPRPAGRRSPTRPSRTTTARCCSSPTSSAAARRGPGCGGNPAASVPGSEVIDPQVRDPASLGALHMYTLEKDGTIAGQNGLQKAGVFNIPYQPQDDPAKGCTIHVFWQAPDQNRLVTAWYGRGTRVVDFSNPAQPKQLALVRPDERRHLVGQAAQRLHLLGRHQPRARRVPLHGRGRRGWPATSGPAEAQRARAAGRDHAQPYRPRLRRVGAGQQSQGPRMRVGRKAVAKHVRIRTGATRRSASCSRSTTRSASSSRACGCAPATAAWPGSAPRWRACPATTATR